MSSEQPHKLKSRALRGFTFFGTQTLLSKVAGLISQYALSWLLLPADFGLLGLAYTVTNIVGVTTQIGLREFLVRRQRNDLWVEPALWLAFALSTICAALMCAFAPIAAHLYHDARIESLVMVLAAGQPFNGMNVVLSAVLQKQLRFARLAAIGLIATVGAALLSVVLAWFGWGVYSLVVPVSLSAALQFAALGKLSGLRLRWRPRFRRWGAFGATGAQVFATNTLMTLNSQGDYVILGILQSATAVGIYFFAFNLSVQVNRFFWTSFSGVLFPLMSSIQHDTERLVRSFRQTAGAMAVVVVPVCILQATLADPVVRLFFAAKWLSAIPAIQMMSIGIGLHTIAEPCVPLLQARGGFSTLTRFTAVWALFYIPTIYVAARLGGVFAVAGAVAIFYAVASPIYFYFVVRPLGMTLRDVAGIYLPSAIASLSSAAVATKLCSILHIKLAASLLVIPAVFVCCYALMITVLAGKMVREVFVPLVAYVRERTRYRFSNV
jgi:O-antigen/teichoic acid export membrane protein